MKKILLVFLLVSLWNLGFSEIAKKKIVIHYGFPVEKLHLLGTVQHDTAIFDRTDTIYETKWEWGIFYPHRYKAPYTQDYYYNVSVSYDALVNTTFVVMDNISSSDEPKQIGPYVSNPLLFRWMLVGILLAIHCYVFWVLRKLLFWIHADGRYVKIRRQRRETILSVVVTILLTVGMGWLVHSYLFLFLPALYLILIFLPARTWYSGMTKREMDLDSHKGLKKSIAFVTSWGVTLIGFFCKRKKITNLIDFYFHLGTYALVDRHFFVYTRPL